MRQRKRSLTMNSKQSRKKRKKRKNFSTRRRPLRLKRERCGYRVSKTG